MVLPVSVYNALLTLFDMVLLGLQIIYFILEAAYESIIPRKEKELQGEVAVVTGGGHGIGLELVRQLSDLGVKVAVWDINGQTANLAVKEIEKKGGLGLPLTVDVSDRESIRRAVDKTRSELGEVTLLFNNAGIMPCKPFLNHSGAEIQKIFEVNVFSQYWTLMEFLPRMISLNRGHIISMSSMAGITGTPNLVPYCSSKFAVKGLMDALFLELRSTHPDTNVKLTTIHPFVVDTGLAQKPRSRFESIIPIYK
ncbi:estradiol 17-beta-dehydrogenase 11 isoform X2 [Eurytemora carolleeae]|uniref:estradiol 17-beta-dehydrogenase 11 isoform X2 n=1 Tax=Eurytemora carolleeae TaxID=1294199 RepID=UPI000C77CD94|nr:estradiol 17-beta-dehydrogenase 11 isoform X2 [Eurytemora carolleeae]|eukprot:XP_023339915.1 estradiol 17-beta-dehydrogenase 11-like isoform X2 [Eurytemora affinis]